MKISESEAVVQDEKEVVHVEGLQTTLVNSIQEQLRELQKAADATVSPRERVDNAVTQDENQNQAVETQNTSEQFQFKSAVLQLVTDVPVTSQVDKELVEKLLIAGQPLPLAPEAQAREDMDRASERQQQGTEAQAMGELRIKDFAEKEELAKQAIEKFALHGESLPGEVRQTAAELRDAFPQQRAEINLSLSSASGDEVFELRRRRVELAAEVTHYEALVKVVDRLMPAPDQNALTEEDMNARAAVVHDEPRYAGSPGTAAEGVSESRTGMHFNEYNAAEVGLRMRFDYDPELGYARSVDWEVGSQVGNFGTRPGAFTRQETLDDIAAQQASHDDFRHIPAERGHATAQQFSGGDEDIAKELMKMSNVWVMLGRGADGVNQGAYKDVEDKIVELRANFPQHAIHVRVDAVIEGQPRFITSAGGNNLVVPDRFDFEITRTPADGGMPIVERFKVENRQNRP